MVEKTKAYSAYWKELTGESDAAVVLLTSDPGVAATVKRSDVARVDEGLGPACAGLFGESEAVAALLRAVLNLKDVPDDTPVFAPNTEEADVELVIESTHPYDNSMDKYWPIEFEGAEAMYV